MTILLTSVSAQAKDNYLHTIRLENNNDSYNIILETDSIAKIEKTNPSDKELVLVLNGITSSDNVNALYKGANNIDSLVVENLSKNKTKIYISGDNIKKSTIMISPENGEETIVGETFPIEKLIWTIFVFGLFCVIFKSAKTVSYKENSPVFVKKNLKDREIEIYKKYKREFTTINSKNDLRMRKIMKKIDRKIDERLTIS